MFGFIFVALGLSLTIALVENEIEIYPLLKSDSGSLSFELLSVSHFHGLNEIKLQINHEDKDYILQFNKNELFHPKFTVSAANTNEINDITKDVNNWISKDCYYHSKHGVISLCDGLEGDVKLGNINYKMYSFKNDSNQMQFYIQKQSDSGVDHVNSLGINRRELLPNNNGYPTCDGGYWDSSTNSKKTAYISMFVAVSPRLQKYNHYNNRWQQFEKIPALVAARVNTFQQNYHNMGFDSSEFSEASITLNFKLKHLHIMDAESDGAYTDEYDVKTYVDANNLENLYGPWSLGAMFIYGNTNWDNTTGLPEYPNSDVGAKPLGNAKPRLKCSICSDNPYYAIDPEIEFDMEHEAGYNLGATADPYCSINGKDASCAMPSIMCNSGGYAMELPKSVGCSYDEISCCIDNILQISDCLDSPFDFISYTNSDTDCVMVQQVSGNDLMFKCMGNLRMTPDKFIATIPLVNHWKMEFTISMNTLYHGNNPLFNLRSYISYNVSDPRIDIHFDTTTWFFDVWFNNNPTISGTSTIICESQALTLPCTDIPVIIEVDQMNDLFTVTVNGSICTDTRSGKLIFAPGSIRTRNIYCPYEFNFAQIPFDGTIKDFIVTLYGTSMNPSISPSQAPTITYCESIQRYYGTSLKAMCLGNVNMKSGTLIDTIPLVNHFKIEFELSIGTLNTGYTNILLIGSPNGDISDRYPSIFIHNDGNFGNTYFQIGITKSELSGIETFIECKSQKIGLPINAMPISIEIDESMLFVSINGNECSDNVLNSPVSYTASGFKNIYIPNSDGILSGGSIENLVITMYDVIRTECILGTNYWFEGNQVYTKGDPHFRMWNGDYHDYQGIGSIDNQYYYITRDENSNSKDLPFNILGKHYYWIDSGDTQMRALDYITIQLFDSNNDYYLIFLQNNILKYTTNSVPFLNTSTLYDNINTSLLSTFSVGIEYKIGKLFSAQITSQIISQTTNIIQFTLTIGGSCQLTLHMQNIGSPKALINNRYVQDLFIDPPNCYKCFITGLFGDFKRPNVDTGSHREQRNAEIPLCNGGYKDIKAGWTTYKTIDPMVHNTAFDSNGLSYDKTFCDRGPTTTRRRILNNEYIISTPDDFIYSDLCPSNSETAQLTITECQNIRTQYDSTLCASDTMKIICDSLQSYCEYDACLIANGDTSKVLDAVENIFGNSLEFLQTIPNIINLYNADDIVAQAGAPTDPTNEPTMQPTVETTKDKETDVAKKMNVYCLLYVVFGLCLFQIII